MANPIGGLGRVLFGDLGKDVADTLGRKIGALPSSSKVEYVSTDVIADNIAQFNLPRYDVGKFGGDFESGNLGENPAILDAFNASGKPTLKESIAREGIKEPIEIEVALKNGEVSIGQGHHRLQAAIELGMEKVPVIIKTQQNPRTGRTGDGAVKPAIVNLSGISKKSAREIQERGGTVYMDFETGDVSDRRFPSTYTPIRNLDKLRE